MCMTQSTRKKAMSGSATYEVAYDPSSATRPPGRHDCNSSAPAGLGAMKGCAARRRLAPGPGDEYRCNGASHPHCNRNPGRWQARRTAPLRPGFGHGPELRCHRSPKCCRFVTGRAAKPTGLKRKVAGAVAGVAGPGHWRAGLAEMPRARRSVEPAVAALPVTNRQHSAADLLPGVVLCPRGQSRLCRRGLGRRCSGGRRSLRLPEPRSLRRATLAVPLPGNSRRPARVIRAFGRPTSSERPS